MNFKVSRSGVQVVYKSKMVEIHSRMYVVLMNSNMNLLKYTWNPATVCMAWCSSSHITLPIKCGHEQSYE